MPEEPIDGYIWSEAGRAWVIASYRGGLEGEEEEGEEEEGEEVEMHQLPSQPALPDVTSLVAMCTL